MRRRKIQNEWVVEKICGKPPSAYGHVGELATSSDIKARGAACEIYGSAAMEGENYCPIPGFNYQSKLCDGEDATYPRLFEDWEARKACRVTFVLLHRKCGRRTLHTGLLRRTQIAAYPPDSPEEEREFEEAYRRAHEEA